LILKSFRIEKFRNIANASVKLGDNLNLVVGLNASGKTNFLEAVFYLMTGRSIRNAKESLLIGRGGDYARVAGVLDGREGERKIEFGFNKAGKKHLYVDGARLQRVSRLLDISAVVSVAPIDIDIAAGSPDNRRKFLDALLSHCFPSYFLSLTNHQKALKQKNSLLKEGDGRLGEYLEAWNRQLAEYGANLLARRMAFIPFLRKRGAQIYRQLAQSEEIDFRYQFSGGEVREENIRDDLSKALRAVVEREKAIRQAIIGPHRDDVEITVDKLSLKDFGSRGQQRCAMLAMKFAALEYLEKVRGEKPILLLDEAVSELDEVRSANLLGISESVGQVIMASSHGVEGHGYTGNVTKFHIESGKITSQ